MTDSISPRLLSTALWVFILTVTYTVLVLGESLLIPLVLTLFIWYMINLIAGLFRRFNVAGWQLPNWLAFGLSGGSILCVIWLVVSMVSNNMANVVQAAPEYQANLTRMLNELMQRFDITEAPDFGQLFGSIDFGTVIQRVATSIGNLLGNAGLILVYLMFLFLEQGHFRRKLAAIAPSDKREQEILGLLEKIDRDIRTYIGIKSLVSALTATVSWVIMKFIGLDFAEFWAVLIFVLNFIPNIGSLAATALPSLLALVQFDTLGPFAAVIIGVGATQLLVGNLLEPSLMGRSLNVSPLVIMLSLVLWGFIWGIPGMFLCVPITVISMIVLYHFDNTRWIALMLSQDGQIKH
jgi:predicted PurR-regulated permease PerM